MDYCEKHGIPVGPPQHDGIAVHKYKTDGTPIDPVLLAQELTGAVSHEIGFEMIVEYKEMHPPKIVDDSKYTNETFVNNYHVVRSLATH